VNAKAAVKEGRSMNAKMSGVLMIIVCLSFLVAQGVSQSPPAPTQLIPGTTSPSTQPIPAVSAAVGQTASSAPDGQTSESKAFPAAAPAENVPAQIFLVSSGSQSTAVSATSATDPRKLTFEQLHTELRRIHDAQKVLKEQETALIAAMEKKVEEKRKELQSAEAILQQLQGKTTSTMSINAQPSNMSIIGIRPVR
jgi:hypothetical protein